MKDWTLEYWDTMIGEEVDICDGVCECEKWTVGEHRCSCGNRRIYLDNKWDDIYLPEGD